MLGTTPRQGTRPATGEQAYCAVGSTCKYERQRTWPKCSGEAPCLIIGDHVGQRCIVIRIMTNQRIEPRPFLRGEDGRYGAVIGCIRTQSIDRFGSEGDQQALAQQGCGTSNADRIRAQQLGHPQRTYRQALGMAMVVSPARVLTRRDVGTRNSGSCTLCSTLPSLSQP